MATLTDLSFSEEDINDFWKKLPDDMKEQVSLNLVQKYYRSVRPDLHYFLYEVYDAATKDPSLLEKDLKSLTPMRDWFTLSPERDSAILACEKKLEKPVGVIKGMYTCKGCGCDEFFMDEKQTRGGDEGATLFVKCGNCGKRFKA